MKFFFVLVFIGSSSLGIAQQNDIVDKIDGLGMYKFGSTLEHCDCLDENNIAFNPCEKYPKNLYSYGYQVQLISLNFSKKTDKLNTVTIYFDGSSQVKRDYIFKEMKKKYGDVLLSDAQGDSWIGGKNTVFLSKGKVILISYTARYNDLNRRN